MFSTPLGMILSEFRKAVYSLRKKERWATAGGERILTTGELSRFGTRL